MRCHSIVNDLARAHRDCLAAVGRDSDHASDRQAQDRAAKSIAKIKKAIEEDPSLTQSWAERTAEEIMVSIDEYAERRYRREGAHAR